MFCQPRSVTPIHPRTSFYKGDGSGRDLYILKDSGGLIKGGFRTMAGSTGRAVSNNRGCNSRLDGKPVHYHSDGTGRDNYITINSGGFARAGVTSDNFYTTLRSYDKCRGVEQKDYFTRAQRGRILKRAHETIDLSLKTPTSKLIDRLSSPKKNYSKYVGEDDSPKFRISKSTLSPVKSMKSFF